MKRRKKHAHWVIPTYAFVLSLALLSGCADYVNTSIVDATVISKKHTSSETMVTPKYNPATKMTELKTETTAEEWRITVKYENIQREFRLSTQEEFDSYTIGIL